MKKLLIMLFIVLFITPVVCADDFRFMPANTPHIMDTAKALKSDDTLNVVIMGYNHDAAYKDVPVLANNVRVVRKLYLDVGIAANRIKLGFALGKGELWRKYNFGEDGVYIKLVHRR
jgi:hypothetical protein